LNGHQPCTVPDLCAKVARTFSQQEQAIEGALAESVWPHLFISRMWLYRRHRAPGAEGVGTLFAQLRRERMILG
jgi:hypothetical protein